MARKVKTVSKKKIITKRQAQKRAEKIATRVARDVLEPHGFSVSTLSRKDKKEFKKGLTQLIFDQVIKDKYVIKSSKVKTHKTK